MNSELHDATVMGKITSAYGVKGWVKVFSYTQPKENLKAYPSWTIQRGKQVKQVDVLDCKPHGNGLIARISGVNDREVARELADFLIKVPKSELPELDDGDYYWHQLEGLRVFVRAPGSESERVLLGKVGQMMETGANDVMVVRPCADSLDKKERLVPYLVDQVVKGVSLADGEIEVEWDPDF